MSFRGSERPRNRGVSCRKAALAEASLLRQQRKPPGLRRMVFQERAGILRDRRASPLLTPRGRSRNCCRPVQRQIPLNTRGGGGRGGASESRFRATQMCPFSLLLLSPHTAAIDRQVKLAEVLLPCSCRSLFQKGQ